MKSLRIDSCSFGSIVINGKTYTDDLVIHPDGKILKPWRRKRGHQLSMDDLRELIDSAPEVIVAGTGVSGGMKSDIIFESGGKVTLSTRNRGRGAERWLMHLQGKKHIKPVS
jgi:uncharacterized protein